MCQGEQAVSVKQEAWDVQDGTPAQESLDQQVVAVKQKPPNPDCVSKSGEQVVSAEQQEQESRPLLVAQEARPACERWTLLALVEAGHSELEDET